MIVRCPECKREYNLELNDAVVELNFTCPNCGLEFKVRNTGMTDVEKHNEKYAPRTTTATNATNAIQEPNTQDDDLFRYLESKKKRKRGPIHISSISRALFKERDSAEEGSSSRLMAAIIIMGIVFAISLAIWIYVNVRT